MTGRLQRRLQRALLFGLLTVSTAAGQESPNVVSFPQQSRAVSPDGRFVIVGQSQSEPFHTAFLEDQALKTRRKLFDYDRHIDLLWNPDSKSFAVTDYGESDYSRCTIISVGEKASRIEVWNEILKALTQSERKTLLENHHVYIAAVEWIGTDALKVKV